MRTIRVEWREFQAALETGGELCQGYVDLDDGRVYIVDEELRERARELADELAPDASVDDALRAIREEDIAPDFFRGAWLAETGSGHLVRLDPDDFKGGYADLRDFTQSVADPKVRRDLEGAIDGPGAFRRFRGAIDQCFRERLQWFAFREQRTRERATGWFRMHDIAVEWILPPPRTGPSPRQHLLGGVLTFVGSASRMSGVKRIALIGSLTRDEPEPKDADLLVTVADDMDLTSLAKAGRKLAGHAQQLNRGADVFLANERGEYIGRTCSWRDCGPGIRASCDAWHCGRRHYLHDDFDSVRLDAKLIAEPPLELWPAVQTRVPVPPDVQEHVLTPLQSAPAG